MPLVSVSDAARSYDLEYEWLNESAPRDRQPIVFLHEGLGSVAAWRDYPATLCRAAGRRGVVYSRYGYGRSTQRPASERWTPSYLFDQARDALPAFLSAMGLGDARPWLFGHSDGSTIALIYAALYPDRLSGEIVLAPHLFLEEVARRGIVETRARYEGGDLKQRLARYHDNPDSPFWAWHDAWMDQQFDGWNIESMLTTIRCPVLAIQGYDDEYGTMLQLDAVQRVVPHAATLRLVGCGHVPFRDAPDTITTVAVDFIARCSPEPAPAVR